MAKLKIYHNPRCTKSRQTLTLLKEKGEEPDVVEYLKTPPTESEIRDLITKMGGDPSALVRTKEDLYKSLGFDLTSSEVVAKNLAENPKLLERPIVVNGNKAAIGRPPENVLEVL